VRVRLTRANGFPALALYLRSGKSHRLRAIQVLRFARGRILEAVTFIDAHYLRGFALPQRIA
jgi:ketosteroid isomerase-like protein